MRRLLVWVPEGSGRRVRELARDSGTTDVVYWSAQEEQTKLTMVMLQVANRQVGPLVGRLGELDGLRVSMFPEGVLALEPPRGRAPQHVVDVTLRSPLEIFLGGLQSVGSWRGFLAYAAASGLVVWVGLFTNTAYLLTAAMLIAPFAGPAMNTAVATARGDLSLLRRTVVRYVGAVGGHGGGSGDVAFVQATHRD